MSESSYGTTCQKCSKRYDHAAYRCKLEVYMENIECSNLRSKCFNCGHWNLTFLSPSGFATYRASIGIAKHNINVFQQAPADLQTEAAEAWKAVSKSAENDELEAPIKLPFIPLGHRQEAAVAKLRDTLADFRGFPVDGIKCIEGTPVSDLPIRWIN